MGHAGKVDHAAIKTGQLGAVAVLVAAFVMGRWELVAVLAGVFLVSAVAPAWGPFAVIYRWLLKPLGLVKPDWRTDNLQPHQFGQAVGAVSAALSATLIYVGHGIPGWMLLWILIGLTVVSYMGWCIGCFIYYQLNRFGLGGFFRFGPTETGKVLGTHPGKRVE